MPTYYKIHSYSTSVPPLPLAGSSLNAQNAPLSTNSIQTASYSSSIENTLARATEAQDDLYYRFFGRRPIKQDLPNAVYISKCPPRWSWPPNYECYRDTLPPRTPVPTWICKSCNWRGLAGGEICYLRPNHPDYVPEQMCYNITGYDSFGRCIQGRPAKGSSCCMCTDNMYYGYCTSGIVPGCKKPTPDNPGDDGFGGNTGEAPQDPFQPIVIEDIYYASNPEIVKIRNLGNQKQSMSGWRLVSHDGTIVPACPILEQTQTYIFPNNFEIEPQQTALLASYTNAQNFVTANSGSGLFWTELPIWNNVADIGILYNPSGAIASTYTYGDCANNATAGCVKVKTINFVPSGTPVCTTIANLKTDNKCYPNEYMAIRSGVTGFFNVTCPPNQFCKSNALDFFENIKPTSSINRWTYEDCPSLLGNFVPDGVVNFTFENCDCAPVVARLQVEEASVISKFSAGPAPSRTCSTSSSVTFKQPVSPWDYGFIAADSAPFGAMEGTIDVTCSNFSPDSDPRNYCYNTVGAKASYDLSSWSYSGHKILGGTVDLTNKYKVDGFRLIHTYTFEDCGIDPVDYVADIEYSEAPCLPDDPTGYDQDGRPLPSPCTKYISECLGEKCDLNKFTPYARSIKKIPYSMDFEFEVKIKVNRVKCCEILCRYVPKTNDCHKKTKSVITSEDIAQVKNGGTLTKEYFVWKGRQRWIDDVYHYYATAEIKRTKFAQITPNDNWRRDPQIIFEDYTTDGINEIPLDFANTCISDYNFIIPTPANADPSLLENLNDVADASSYLFFLKEEADKIIISTQSTSEEYDTKTLAEVSTGNEIIANTIDSEIQALLPVFRQNIRNWIASKPNIRLEYAIENAMIPGLTETKQYALNSVAYLTIDAKTSAKPIPKRHPATSCFGCSINWDFAHDFEIFGSPNP